MLTDESNEDQAKVKENVCIVKIDEQYNKILCEIDLSEKDKDNYFYLIKSPIPQIITIQNNKNIIEIKEIIQEK